MGIGTRNYDIARLYGLAQGFQNGAGKFGELVQKQHTVIGQRNLPRPRITATTHQSHTGGGVMRCAKGASAPLLDGKTVIADGGHCGGFQRLGFIHRRQDSGQATGEHGLAGSGRADHEQVGVRPDEGAGAEFEDAAAVDVGVELPVESVERFHVDEPGGFEGAGGFAVGAPGEPNWPNGRAGGTAGFRVGLGWGDISVRL